MALCHALGLLREKMGFRLLAISLDHGLREEARGEVSLVRRFCAEADISFHTRCLGLKAGANLQKRARDARYQALREVAQEHFGTGYFLATAHHKDDRAETVLLRILRGTSIEGLSVLPPRAEDVLRPMIRAGRSDVLTHLERHSVPSVQDPSNVDPRFLRVRVRTELLPLLMELAPGGVDHLVELSEEAAQLSEPLGLNREQRRQIRQALQDPRIPVNLRLPGGLVFSREKHPKSSEE
jgi:tRNA(Ile)-lysidine synthase